MIQEEAILQHDVALRFKVDEFAEKSLKGDHVPALKRYAEALFDLEKPEEALVLKEDADDHSKNVIKYLAARMSVAERSYNNAIDEIDKLDCQLTEVSSLNHEVLNYLAETAVKASEGERVSRQIVEHFLRGQGLSEILVSDIVALVLMKLKATEDGKTNES